MSEITKSLLKIAIDSLKHSLTLSREEIEDEIKTLELLL